MNRRTSPACARPPRAAPRGPRARRRAASPSRRRARGPRCPPRPSSQAPPLPATSTSRWRRPGRGLERVDLAVGDHAPAADDHDVLAHLLDEVELVRAEHDADARRGALAQHLGHRLRRRAGRGPRTARRGRAAPGRGPAPSRAGSAAGCRGTGPPASTSRGRRGRTARARRPSRARRVAAGQAVVLGEVRQLLADAHPRVEAALLGHVPEPQPRVRVDGPPVPATPRRPRGRRARRCSASSSSCRRRSARGSRAAGRGAPSATRRRAP